MVGVASIHSLLVDMAQILRKHGQYGHADLVAALAVEEDAQRFADQVSGLAFWGGSGSVVDAAFDDAADDLAFNRMIVDLAEALDQLGLANPRVQWVAQTIEDWLNSNPTI